MNYKALLLSSVAAISASAFFISPAISASAESSVIVSCDFDDKELGKWATFGGGSIALDTSAAHSGDTSVKITGRKNSYEGPSLNCDDIFNAAETYDFDGWVYHEGDSAKTISWTVKYIDSYGNEAFTQIASADVEPGVWTELTSSLAISEDAVSYLIYFECSDAALDFFIDDVTISGNAAVSKQDDAKEYLDKYNMDFENDTEQWVSRGDMKVVLTDAYSQSGSQSLYATNRTNTWNGPTATISDKIIKNESYYYSAYVMFNGKEYADSHVFRMELQYTVNGAVTYNLIADKNIKKGKWTEISGYYTVPEEAENISLYIQTDNIEEGEELTPDDLMSYYVDNVTIAKAGLVKKSNNIKLAIIIGCTAAALAVLFVVGLLIFKRHKKNSEALELVSIDAMTRVFNRNAYEKKAAELESDAEKLKTMYFALCDVNFLKYINDNYGHDKGDAAIIRCAELLKKIIGKSGNVYRTGGDEFVCMSRKPIKDEILRIAEAEKKIDKGYPFAVACGFAVYDSKRYPTFSKIIAECDKEMYDHKQKIKSENKEFSRQ
ncbi:MAG: carbohydrate binding domain-containing protein [Ruminococcus sp.]|nr:carbohydrate binding domain-containing protein [Ruminococcus sp.]